MARFLVNLPDAEIKQIKKMERNLDEIFAAMTKAGAEVVADNIRSNAPPLLRDKVRLTRDYKTPSDGGINTKVYISGYIPFSDKNRKYFARRGRSGGQVYTTTKGVPADFLANIYEYGRSNAPFPKHPFLRKSFGSTSKIERAILEAQRQASGGMMDE